MVTTIELGWINGQVDFTLTKGGTDGDEIAALHFKTPRVLPSEGKVILKAFEMDGGPVPKISGWSTTPGDLTSHPTSGDGEVAPSAELRVAETTDGGHKHKTHPADLLADTDYYWNMKIGNAAPGSYPTRVTMKIPRPTHG